MLTEVKTHKLSLRVLSEALQAADYLDADEEITKVVVDGRTVILTTETPEES